MRSKIILVLSLIILILMFTSLPKTTGAQSPLPTPTPVSAGPSFGPPDNNTLFGELIFPIVLAILAFFGGYLIKRPIDKWLERREKARQEEEQRRKKALEEEAARRMAAAEDHKHREIVDSRAAAYLEGLCKELRNLKILDMDHPLDLENTYIRVRVRTQAQRTYPTAEQELEFTRTERDPNEWFALHRAWYTERAQSAIPPEEALRQYRHCAILGDPGAGKTTMLQYLALTSAQNHLADLPTFPIFISLHDFTSSGSDSLLDFATHVLDSRFGFPEARPFLESRFEAGELLLLLDGLDEVNIGVDEDEARRHYERAVAEIHTIASRFPQAPIVVTSRFAGWRGGLPASFHHLEVLDLGTDDVESFVANWFSQSDPTRADDLQRELTRNARIATLAANPLLLALICIVYTKRLELPERRAELYRQCVDVLLNKWDSSRKIQRTRTFTTENKRDLLEHLAWHFHCQGRRYFPRDELLQAIAAFLPQIGLPAEDNGRILAEITAQHGLLKQQAIGWYGFLHLTLQEYFAAVEAFQTAQLPALIKHLYEPWWEEVILLFASQGDAAPLLRAILDQPEDIFHSNLRLAGRCLVSHPRVSDPALSTRIRIALCSRLRAARFSYEAELIARVLAELGNAESNSCLLSLLSDANIASIVRVMIVRALGKLGDHTLAPDLLNLLPNENIDSSVRWNIATALGELGEHSVAPDLLTLLRNEDIENSVRVRIIFALGTLGGRAIAPQLVSMLSDENIDIGVRQNIFSALGMLGESTISPKLLILLRDKNANSGLRARSAIILGALGERTMIPDLLALLQNENTNSSVQLAIASALGMLGERTIASDLLALLSDEKIDSNVRQGIAVALGALGEQAVAPGLVALLSDEKIDSNVRQGIAYALSMLGEHTVAHDLLILLSDENIALNVRWYIASTLGALGDHTVVPGLLAMLSDENADRNLRGRIAVSLGTLEEFAVTSDLLTLLSDEEIALNVRGEIARALTALKAYAVAPDLLNLLPDENIENTVRQEIAITLGALGDHTVVPGLLAMLSDENIDQYVRKNIVTALGMLEAHAVVPDLLTLLSNKTISFLVRLEIADILGMLGDTAELVERMAELLPTSAVADYIYPALHRIILRTGKRVLKGERVVPISSRSQTG